MENDENRGSIDLKAMRQEKDEIDDAKRVLARRERDFGIDAVKSLIKAHHYDLIKIDWGRVRRWTRHN